jgi:hypothetical protein
MHMTLRFWVDCFYEDKRHKTFRSVGHAAPTPSMSWVLTRKTKDAGPPRPFHRAPARCALAIPKIELGIVEAARLRREAASHSTGFAGQCAVGLRPRPGALYLVGGLCCG